MKRSEPVELMNMCVLRRGSKVLVQDRTDSNWPGVAFPGGHVEKGESFTDAVIREVQEETGLTISSPRLCGIKDWCEDGVRHVARVQHVEHSVCLLPHLVLLGLRLAGKPPGMIEVEPVDVRTQ